MDVSTCVFIRKIMTDDLRANCKYTNSSTIYTTLSELITPSSSPSNMTDYLTYLLTWTANDVMQLNTSKTKEMILGRIDSTSIPSLSTSVGPIQRVTHYLQVTWPSSWCWPWTTHINTIVSKASKRLYFLKQLRKAGVPRSHHSNYSIFIRQ